MRLKAKGKGRRAKGKRIEEKGKENKDGHIFLSWVAAIGHDGSQVYTFRP
jgi:hypothetical protein